MTDATDPKSGTSMPELDIKPPERRILLPVEKCIQFSMKKIGGKTIEMPEEVMIHATADEVLKIIPVVTVEETGAMMH